MRTTAPRPWSAWGAPRAGPAPTASAGSARRRPRLRRSSRPGSASRPSPLLQNSLDLDPHSVSCLGSVHAGHQQLVVASVLVSHRRDHGKLDGLRVQGSSGGGPPHSTASPRPGTAGNGFGALRGAPGKQAEDLPRQLALEAPVLPRPPRFVAQPAPRPGFLVLQALRLSALERDLLDEDPLALVPFPRSTETDDDCRKATRSLRAAGQRRVSRGQEDEVIHVGAFETEWPALLHHQEIAATATVRACPVPDRRDHHEVGRATLALAKPLPLVLG